MQLSHIRWFETHPNYMQPHSSIPNKSCSPSTSRYFRVCRLSIEIGNNAGINTIPCDVNHQAWIEGGTCELYPCGCVVIRWYVAAMLIAQLNQKSGWSRSFPNSPNVKISTVEKFAYRVALFKFVCQEG